MTKEPAIKNIRERVHTAAQVTARASSIVTDAAWTFTVVVVGAAARAIRGGTRSDKASV